MSARTDLPRRPQRPAPSAEAGTARPIRAAQLVAVLLIVALAVGIAGVLLRDGGDGATSAVDDASSDTSAGADSDGSDPGGPDPADPITVGEGPVTVAIYYDYLCPACGAFEAANGDELDRLIGSDAITVELRPISFLDRLSAGTEYSTRAANALATVVEASPEHVWDLHRELYANQPAEGGPGLTDEELEALATDVGVPAEVAATFAERRFDAWTAERTERAFADGVEGTPTIVIDGEVFTGDPYTQGDLTAAVEAAQ